MRLLADARNIPLQTGCVQCCVTSPPYWGLRDYGTARWEGGDAGCDHTGTVKRTAPPGTAKQASNFGANQVLSGDCACGARRIDAQIGLEPTPDAYVAALVGVFREVWRVLRDDGTLWLNLGDSYASSPPGNTTVGVSAKSGLHGVNDASGTYRQTLAAGHATKRNTVVGGLKPKDLVGIPWRVAFALQAEGWYLRSDIIWAKPNPMPESVTDRPTKAHEYVFLLTKRERYYYDADAIQERSTGQSGAAANFARATKRVLVPGQSVTDHRLDRVPTFDDGTRNARSVWTINPKPYAEAHFATMPEKLAERCIKAGSKPGDLVLDPFGGSGTTVKVARSLNRRGVMLDLNPAYLDLAKQRNANLQPSLLETEASA